MENCRMPLPMALGERAQDQMFTGHYDRGNQIRVGAMSSGDLTGTSAGTNTGGTGDVDVETDID